MYNEDVGKINVCVELKEPRNGCGVEFEFNVNITTASASAGTQNI